MGEMWPVRSVAVPTTIRFVLLVCAVGSHPIDDTRSTRIILVAIHDLCVCVYVTCVV